MSRSTTRTASLILAAVALIAGCRSRQANEDADAGDGIDEVDTGDATDATDLEYEPHCCPLGSPSCECTHVGGSPDEEGRCETVCDTLPDGWILMTDLEGCLYWEVPDDAGPCSAEAVEGIEETEAAPEMAPEPVEPGPDADVDMD